jgi:hypothetical protein
LTSVEARRTFALQHEVYGGVIWQGRLQPPGVMSAETKAKVPGIASFAEIPPHYPKWLRGFLRPYILATGIQWPNRSISTS